MTTKAYFEGETLLLQGKTTEAAGYLALALNLLPNDAYANGNLAIALHQVLHPNGHFYLNS
jgi:hypothetical protein